MGGAPPCGGKPASNAEVLLLRQSTSGKDSAAKVDDSLRTNHLAVCCDVGPLTIGARF